MEWINVKTRLPERNMRVLVIVDRYIAMAEWNTEWKWFGFADREDTNAFSSRAITHWMPLPELPKERHSDWERPLLLCDGVTVESRLPGTPVEYIGKADGKAYYFKARGSRWKMVIAENAEACIAATREQASFYCTGHYGKDEFAAGYMPLEQAEAIIRHCVQLWRDAQSQD